MKQKEGKLNMKINETLPDFFRWLRFNRNVNDYTVYHYGKVLQKFIADMGDLEIKKIQVEDIWKWRETLTNRGIANNSQKNYLLSVKNFLRFCVEKKLSQIDCNQIKPPKTLPPKEVVYLSNGEVKQFVEMFKNIKYRALVEILLSTGLRISELLALNRDDVRNQETKIIGKNNKERMIYFSDRAMRWLNKYLKTRKDNDPALFLSNEGNRLARGTVENIFRLYREINGMEKKITPHSLRHTAGTNLYLHTKDIALVKDFLGHTDISVTDRFYRGCDREKLKEGVKNGLNYED